MKISKLIENLQLLQEEEGNIHIEARNTHGDTGEPRLSSSYRWISGEADGEDVWHVTSQERLEDF